MTEAQWLSCDDPQQMLKFRRVRGRLRKLRLFGCVCCRRIWHHLSDGSREVVMLAERFAEGLVGEKERLTARRQSLRETVADKTAYATLARYAGASEVTRLLASSYS